MSSVVKSLSSCQLVWKKHKVWKRKFDGKRPASLQYQSQVLSCKRRSKTRVNILFAFAFACWSQLKEFHRLKSRAKLATYLLDQKAKATFLFANWESTLTLSHQINMHNINAHNHYWFKMNSLLYHKRFITGHDWVCLTLAPLDHEMYFAQWTGNHLRGCASSNSRVVMWMQWRGGAVSRLNITSQPLLFRTPKLFSLY